VTWDWRDRRLLLVTGILVCISAVALAWCSATTVNRLSLIIGITGTVMTLKWGLPQESAESFGIALEDATVLEDGRTVKAAREESEHRVQRQTFLARVGLALLVTSFVLPFAASFVAKTQP